jgi:hypothetical protein
MQSRINQGATLGNVLFGSISDATEWVYHYTSLKTALELLLPSEKLRLGPFSTVNDPRESKRWFFSVATPDGFKFSGEEFFRLQELATSLVKSKIKVLCTCQDDPRAVADGLDYTFHRGYARPRMWAQYGGGHSGVCLVLDRKALDNRIRTELIGRGVVYSGPVEYVNSSRDEMLAFHLDHREILAGSLESVLRAKVDRHHRTYFFTKAEDWSSEIEWRWVLRGADSEPEYVSIRDSLKAIVLGEDFPSVYEPAIVPFGERYGVPIARMHWMNGRPQASPGPYEP